MLSPISLIWIKNSIGPRTEPFGNTTCNWQRRHHQFNMPHSVKHLASVRHLASTIWQRSGASAPGGCKLQGAKLITWRVHVILLRIYKFWIENYWRSNKILAPTLKDGGCSCPIGPLFRSIWYMEICLSYDTNVSLVLIKTDFFEKSYGCSNA